MKLRHIPFIMLAAVTLALMAATFVEKTRGSDFVATYIYGSWWFVMLWALLAIVSVAAMLKAKLFRRPVTAALHAALLLILAGALTTHLFGQQGSTHLRMATQQTLFVDSEDGSATDLPFALKLSSFQVDNYPGTQSAMDYVSVVDVINEGKKVAVMRISMNHIGQYRGYRFYQSGYDDDVEGTILAVSHDPWGIGITYAGYFLLFLSMLLLLILPNEGLRAQLALQKKRRAIAAGKGVAAIMLAAFTLLATPAQAAEKPKALPHASAEKMGELYAYYNGRICPLETVAKEFTTKLYGKPTYQGLSSMQVLTGWMFFPTAWTEQPFIKVKGEAKKIVGTKGRHASYSDFFGTEGYRLERHISAVMCGEKPEGAQAIREADEKMNILRMLFNGQLIRIFPYHSGHDLQWLSQGDNMPEGMSEDKYIFTKKSLDYAGELIWMKQWAKLDELTAKIKVYQQKEAAELLPSETRFKAEMAYNRIENTRPVAMAALTLGIILFFVYLAAWLRGQRVKRPISIAVNTVTILAAVYLIGVAALRGYVASHLPLSNGYETMQFMALVSLLLTIVMQRRYQMIIPFGVLLTGLTLLVSMMGESNPKITPLMPVLSSPLLSLHVCIIMLAYALLAFTMFNGITALVLQLRRKDYTQQTTQLTDITQLLLYPAVFCLAAGIFIGAIWANQSWGRYWGWDPKEVWALVTLLVYAVPLHRQSIHWLQRPLWFHLYIVAAFLSILMTYFGVNFFLGGMHSYA